MALLNAVGRYIDGVGLLLLLFRRLESNGLVYFLPDGGGEDSCRTVSLGRRRRIDRSLCPALIPSRSSLLLLHSRRFSFSFTLNWSRSVLVCGWGTIVIAIEGKALVLVLHNR